MTKFKKNIIRLVVLITSMFLVFIPSQNGNLHAADLTSSEVDSITTNVGSATPGQKVHFTMTLGNSKQVIHTGDTIHVTFPTATADGAGITGVPHTVSIKYEDPSNPGDPLNGKDVATAQITGTGITITFNSKMNGHVLNSGKLQFTGVVTTKSGTNPTKVNNWPNSNSIPTPSISVNSTPSTSGNQGGTPNIVAPKGTVKKSGTIANNGNINWQVHGVLTNSGTSTIKDTAKDGQKIIPGSVKITYFIQYEDGQWGTVHLTYSKANYPSSEGKITVSGNSLTITANEYNISGALMGVDESGDWYPVKQVAYTITYQTKVSSNEQASQWQNTASQTNPNGTPSGSATATVKNNWHGTIDGSQPKYGVSLLKIGEENGKTVGLAGATFQINGNGITKDAVSNQTGYFNFNGLPTGTYTIKEIKAPKGYKLNPETITVKISDTGVTTVTVNGKNITNDAKVVDTPIATASSSSSIKSSKSSSSRKSSLSKIFLSSSKKSSSVKSLSSKKSSSSKISSSKKSSSIKSSSSSKKSSSSKISSSSKKSSSIKSLSSKESSSSKISSSNELNAPSKDDSSSKESSSNIVSSSSTASSKSIGANSSTTSSSGNGGGNSSSKSQGSQSMTSSLVYTSSIVSVSGETGTSSSSENTGNGLPSKGSSSIGPSTPSQKPVPAPAFSTSVIIKSSYVQVPVPGSGNNNEGGSSGNGSSQNQGSSNIGSGTFAETGNTNGGNAQQNNGAQLTGNQSRENSSISLKTQTSQQQAGQKGNSQQKLPQTGEASSIVIVSLGVAMIVGLGVYLEKNK